MKIPGILRWLLCSPVLLWAQPALAQDRPSQFDYVRSSLDWHTIETEHFNVIFHVDEEGAGSSRSAQVVARIAEEIYGPITELYAHEPDSRVSIIIKDFEDYSNGAAFFFDNKIEIWAPALDSPLRGDHHWLRNVITHEFTHIVQLQAAMKVGRTFPFAYLQVLDYENVRRPDVLNGYPNVIVSYPFASINTPAWFAEGTAQYQRAWMDNDRWDTHRDMFLRTRVLAGKQLSLADMGGFYSKSSLMREGVYNHGFAFTRYLAATYGESALRNISHALAKVKNWNVERAIADALGVPAPDVYDAWMGLLKREYKARTAAVEESIIAGTLLEPDGQYNYYPRFSPDGRQVAYVSNKGQRSSRTNLHIRDLDGGAVVSHDLDASAPLLTTYTCSWGHRVRSGVSGAVTWRPDGKAIVFARRRVTTTGSLFSDLYELDLESRKVKRLTRNRRAALPAYAPDGSQIAFVGQKDGTTNLFALKVASGAVVALTEFENGSQVSDPAWHPSGKWVYFARLSPDGHGRDIWRVNRLGMGHEPVIATLADERSPSFAPGDSVLHYTSDASGIYNLYRRVGNTSLPVTNVLGGAFMPSLRKGGAIAYAHFQWDGYKIALLDPRPSSVTAPAYEAPPVLRAKGVRPLQGGEMQGLNARAMAASQEGGGPGAVAPPEQTTPALSASPYTPIITGFSIFPVLRLDQYVSRRRSLLDSRLPTRSRLGTLARNLKLGSYVSSREVLEDMVLFGGILVGPASREASSLTDFFSPSRLLKLERDAFLLFDYKKGLGFLPQRWSPQFSIELYNISRWVENGLSIEEFPCTACFPDTTLTDLSYTLWEGDLYARSKVSDNLLVELGYRYSPYRVLTERFFSKEAKATIPASSSRYFIGQTILANVYLEARSRHRDSDVNPTEMRLDIGYEYVRGSLLRRFDIKSGLLVPVYGRNRIHRLTLDAKLRYRLPGTVHGVQARVRVSSILGQPVDDFYDDYVGGLTGARGYPFYALGGNETLWAHASYLLPLFADIRTQILFLYVDKAYLRLYADAAAAWSGAWPGFSSLRKDIGAEMRVKLGSSYLLPTAVFLSGTYGLDTFDVQLNDGFVTPSGARSVRYGSELQWHFGVLFEFDT